MKPTPKQILSQFLKMVDDYRYEHATGSGSYKDGLKQFMRDNFNLLCSPDAAKEEYWHWEGKQRKCNTCGMTVFGNRESTVRPDAGLVHLAEIIEKLNETEIVSKAGVSVLRELAKKALEKFKGGKDNA